MAQTNRRQRSQPVDQARLQALCAQLEAAGEQGDAAVLSELVKLAKRKEARHALKEGPRHAPLRALLGSAAPKVRKNAARLLGELADPADTPALIQALENESTLFVLPSLLLALGRSRGEGARVAVETVQKCWTEKEALPEEGKHREEILRAAEQALSAWQEAYEVRCLPLPRVDVCLYPPDGCLPLLAGEAAEKGLTDGRQRGGALCFRHAEYGALSSLRCADEALIPVGKAPLPPVRGGAEALAAWADDLARQAQPFAALLTQCYEPQPIPYRMELRGLPHEQRGRMAHVLARALDGDGQLKNSPSAYVAELRLDWQASHLTMQAKLMQPPDARFAYRKQTLPASISPVTAACIMRFVAPHMQAEARVIDPCCGSATLLVERARIRPLSAGLGVDNVQQAVSAARRNVKAAGLASSIDIVAGDLQRFRPRQPFNELYANLPFGVRVGDGEAAAALHTALFARLTTWMAPGGFALLYSTRHAQIERLAHRAGWRIADEMRFEAGGLSPWAILLRR